MEANKELYISDEFEPVITQENGTELISIIKDFLSTYANNREKPVEEWLPEKIASYLPDKSNQDILEYVHDIEKEVEINSDNRKDLEKALDNGRTKEQWLESRTKQFFEISNNIHAVEHLESLDTAIDLANENLYNTVLTNSGNVNQSICLDGFIAEQYHAQTFNLNAEAAGSEYRAYVLEPANGVYNKNSVDIVIKNGNGDIVRRYQSKYYSTPGKTEAAFSNDYRGQRKLVPSDQVDEISSKASDVIEAPDGTRSNPLSKPDAQKMRDEAQSGNWNDLNWNEYKVQDILHGVGKKIGIAAVLGAAIGAGFELAKQIINGEEIEWGSVIRKALETGKDSAIVVTIASAIKVAAEKGIIHLIPKGTPVSIIADIVYIAIEDLKIMKKMADGELSFEEGMEQIEITSTALIAGMVASVEGATIGASIGMVFGPVGAAIGGFIGGVVGFIAGSKVGEAVSKVRIQIRTKIHSVVKEAKDTIKRGIKNAFESVKETFKKSFSTFNPILLA